MKKNGKKPEPLKYFMLDKICAQCGKPFCVRMPEEYAYKRRASGTRYYYLCSWRCLQLFDQVVKKRGGGHVTNTEKEKIFTLLEQGLSNEEIAEIIGVTRNAVKYWRNYRRAGGQAGG